VVAEEPDDSILNADLAADKPLTLSGKLGRATVLAASSPAVPTSTPTTSPSVSPTSSPAPTDSATLPADVTGQSADQQTCVKGFQP
jgi:hypothetical protein